MTIKKSVLDYSLLIILSIKNYTFNSLGKIIKKSGDTIARLLQPADQSLQIMHHIAVHELKHAKIINVIIDDTLVRKFFAQFMEGAGRFYDTKLFRKIMGYKVLLAGVSDGKHIFPFALSFMYARELLKQEQIISKEACIEYIILTALKLFPGKMIRILADGAFATKKILAWCIEQKLAIEMRMHSNRKVWYKGLKLYLRDIKKLQPRGRETARTIKVVWHDMALWITAERRINRHGEEKIVYQVSTYYAKPSEHVKAYKKRWDIEKLIRTSKQELGLGDCQSTKLETQLDHMAAALLAYSLAQVERKKRKFETVEEAIRYLKRKNIKILRCSFSALDQIFKEIYA